MTYDLDKTINCFRNLAHRKKLYWKSDTKHAHHFHPLSIPMPWHWWIHEGERKQFLLLQTIPIWPDYKTQCLTGSWDPFTHPKHRCISAPGPCQYQFIEKLEADYESHSTALVRRVEMMKTVLGQVTIEVRTGKKATSGCHRILCFPTLDLT